MPRRCSVCAHPLRQSVDLALVERKPFRHIAERYDLSASALVRHHDQHLPSSLVLAKQAEEASRADGLLLQLLDLRNRALAILDKAEMAGDLRTALAAIRETKGCLELLGKVSGELNDGASASVNVSIAQEWVSVRYALIKALDPYPEARAAVATALDVHEGRNDP